MEIRMVHWYVFTGEWLGAKAEGLPMAWPLKVYRFAFRLAISRSSRSKQPAAGNFGAFSHPSWMGRRRPGSDRRFNC